MRGVDERRLPLSLRLIECRTHAIEVVGEPLGRGDYMAERDERRPIAGFNPSSTLLPAVCKWPRRRP